MMNDYMNFEFRFMDYLIEINTKNQHITDVFYVLKSPSHLKDTLRKFFCLYYL